MPSPPVLEAECSYEALKAPGVASPTFCLELWPGGAMLGTSAFISVTGIFKEANTDVACSPVNGFHALFPYCLQQTHQAGVVSHVLLAPNRAVTLKVQGALDPPPTPFLCFCLI